MWHGRRTCRRPFPGRALPARIVHAGRRPRGHRSSDASHAAARHALRGRRARDHLHVPVLRKGRGGVPIVLRKAGRAVRTRNMYHVETVRLHGSAPRAADIRHAHRRVGHRTVLEGDLSRNRERLIASPDFLTPVYQ